VLALPSRDSQFLLETDASNVALGCALNLVESDGALRPVGYYSRTLTTPERNYSATEREALAVVWGVKQARPYLERTSFVIRTDHSALRWLFGASADNQRICRWRLTLAEFRFTVEYKPGPKNIAPDSLSRLPARDPIASDVELDPPVLVIEVPLEHEPTKVRGRPWLTLTKPMPPLSMDEVYDAQQSDEWCRQMCRRAEDGLPGYGWTVDGVLVKQGAEGRVQVLVPERLRSVVTHLAHMPPNMAHPGARRMQDNVSREFIWPTIRRDCARYVAECISCAAVKPSLNAKTRQLQLFPPSNPWEFVCADILGPLPTTIDGHRFLLILSDRFSKFTVAKPMKTCTANDVAETFVSDWVAIFGVPLILLTDNGPQFASKFLQQVSTVLGVHQRFTSAYHPSTNGQV
jgi:hypothetical protein